jgi:pimeloyl-ACP methyl ester carboxylesterase
MLYTTFLKRVFRAVHGPTPERPPGDERSGLVLIADGVGGLDLCGTGLIHVAAKAGSTHEVRIVPWGHGFGKWHRDLTNVENHRLWAAKIVADVADFHASKPQASVYLVGKSGGTGVAVLALEAMPEDSVEAVVLLSSAISPEYDLSRALRAVRRDLTLFWSPLDVFVLGAGTRIFGTIDGQRVVSAGLVGFRHPKELDESALQQYAKLKQVRWSPEMASTGYFGGHVGPDNPAFLKKYVLPLLDVAPESSEARGRGSSPRADAPIT